VLPPAPPPPRPQAQQLSAPVRGRLPVGRRGTGSTPPQPAAGWTAPPPPAATIMASFVARFECAVCQGTATHPTYAALTCGHAYHTECISGWLAQGTKTCPTCRAHASARSIREWLLACSGSRCACVPRIAHTPAAPPAQLCWWALRRCHWQTATAASSQPQCRRRRAGAPAAASCGCSWQRSRNRWGGWLVAWS
jgi:hypothetical protein